MPNKGTSSAPHRKTRATGLGYLPGLDGLRAFAVVVVLLYHGGQRWLPGGFLGVEIFFVISGYLITSLLLAEWRSAGRIDLKRFWLRRARRLLPALFLLLAVTLTYAIVFLPDEVASLRADAVAALSYVTNWYLIVSQKSYFETVGRPSLLRHLWSLAVEEQFYLLWPLILTLLLRRLKPARTAWLVGAGAVASAVLMAVLYQPDVDPSRVYYGTDTRAAGLLTGALLAFVWRPWEKGVQTRRAAGPRLDVVGAAALGVLLLVCLRLGEYDPLLYQGGFVVVGLGSAAVIAAAVHPRARIGGWLGLAPLRWIGLRSYGIYLWHWPIFMVTRPQLDVTLDGLPLLVLRFLLTGIAAELSYRFVEMPIRTGALEQGWRAWREAQGTRRRRLGLRWAGSFAALAALVLGIGGGLALAQTPLPPPYLRMGVAGSDPGRERMLGVIVSAQADVSIVSSSSLSSLSAGADLIPAAPNLLEGLAPVPTPRLTVEAQEADWPVNNRRAVSAQPVATLAGPADGPAAPTALPTATPLFVPAADGEAAMVTAIGDSVMRGAANEVKRTVGSVEVDAQIGRQVSQALELIQARLDAGQLGPIVVVHMGNNGTFSARQFDQMMALLAGRQVIFLNNRVPRSWQESNNTVIAEGVKRYPNTALLDWVAASDAHPEYFWNDGIHLRPEGAKVYAALIAAAIGAK